MKPKKPLINIAALDQASAAVVNVFIPHLAAIFLAFVNSPGITRVEALALTIAYIQKPVAKGES